MSIGMLFKLIGVDRYYKMNDHQLELEASKFHIGEYVLPGGKLSRDLIIKQLIQKDTANLSSIAIVISVLSLFVSLIALIAAKQFP